MKNTAMPYRPAFPRLVISSILFLTALFLPLLPATAAETEAARAANTASAALPQRPSEWAQPMQREGLPNLFRVSPVLYRGAQPEKEGFPALQAMGIKTVVSLRALHGDRSLLRSTALDYERIRFSTWDPEEEQMVHFLRIVTDPRRQPVFVHCQHGADRTGTMIALYRIAVEGWDKEAAIREMTEGGYGFHSIWAHLPVFIRNLDVEKIRLQAGISVAMPVRQEAGNP